MRLSERSEFAPRRLIRASQGTQKGLFLGMHVGCLFFWLLFFGQAKKSHSSIKDEKNDKNINQKTKRKQNKQ